MKNKKPYLLGALLLPLMLAGCSTKCDCPQCPATVVAPPATIIR